MLSLHRHSLISLKQCPPIETVFCRVPLELPSATDTLTYFRIFVSYAF